MPPVQEHALLSGSWYDPTHNGEGYNVEVLIDGRVVVYWFSYDPAGKRRWFFGLGEVQDGKFVFDDIQTTKGGIFGPDFDPSTVQDVERALKESKLGINPAVDGKAIIASNESRLPTLTPCTFA